MSDPDRLGLVGAHLVGTSPVDRVEMTLRPGLTALYGKNGVGKTRLLRLLASALSEKTYQPPTDLNSPHGEPLPPRLTRAATPTMAMYFRSGLHFRWPVTRDLWEDDDHVTPIVCALNDAVTTSKTGKPATRIRFLGDPDPCRNDWDDVVMLVMERLGLDVSVEDVEHLLSSGYWMVGSEPFAPAYLCDPDPTNGPLAPDWQASAGNWSSAIESYQAENPFALPDDRLPPPVADAVWDEEVNHTYWDVERDAVALPPLPSLVLAEECLPWLAVPIAFIVMLGDHNPVSELIEEGSIGDVNKRTATSLPFLRDGGKPLFGPIRFDMSMFLKSESTVDACARHSAGANGLLARLFDEPPLLELIVTDPIDWFHGKPSVAWLATTELGDEPFAIDGLGAAHQRYARFAIQRAVQRRSGDSASTPDRLTFAVIDEPESALHPAAERQLSVGLRSLADYVIVATHSTVVIDTADEIVHLTRNQHGSVQTRPLSVDLTPSQRQSEARRLGQTPGTLASLVRAVVLVEGVMDLRVISAFLHEDLQAIRALVLPLHGTDGLASLPSADYLFHSTDAPIVICLDNINTKPVDALVGELRRAPNQAAQNRLLARARDEVEFASAPEMKKLIQVLEAACTTRRLDRIEVFGFKKRDIVHYLPVELFRPGADSWDQLWNDFRAESNGPPHRGSGQDFKRFVGRSYSVKGVEEALDHKHLHLKPGQTLSSTRPIEFTRLARRLAEVARQR